MSRIPRWSAAAVVLALVTVPSGAAATTADDVVPLGDLVVEGEQVPVRGTFAYRANHDDRNEEIRGLVHGVHRVDGGTVLYYSVGTDATQGLVASSVSSPGEPPYALQSMWDVRLLDSVHLKGYRPVATDDWTFTSLRTELQSGPGELRVGVAIFPELPDDVEAVQVLMPWGTPAGEVPVEEGALEPFSDEPAPRVGEGWPEVATGSRLADVDPARFTYELQRVSSDVEGRAKVEESSERVDVALDANVLFEFDSAQLSAEAQATLSGVAKDIAARATGEVQVVGHTDSEGADAYNQTLSEQRAQAVVAALAAEAGSAVTFSAVGRGEAEPVADNGTPEGRAANRRVTVVYSIEGTS